MTTVQERETERLIRLVAHALSSSSSAATENGDDNHASADLVCLREQLLQRLDDSDASTLDFILHQAKERASAAWSSSSSSAKRSKPNIDTTTNRAPTSSSSSSSVLFSLDQLLLAGGGAGGSLLDSFVSIDRIQQAETPQERLEWLQKIQFMDDVMMDWPEYCQLLADGLQQQQDNADTPALQEQYFQLHRDWFDKTRVSIEYRTIQFDLHQNLMNLIKQEQKEVAKSLVKTCLDQFTDWVQLSRFIDDDRLHDSGKTLLSWFLDSEERGKTDGDGASVAAHMKLLDPECQWLSCWLAHLTVRQTLDLMQLQQERAPKQAQQSNNFFMARLSTVLNEFVANRGLLNEENGTAIVEPESSSSASQFSSSWMLFLRAFLNNIRVLHFPWDLLHLQNVATKYDKIALVARLYMSFLQQECATISSTTEQSTNTATERAIYYLDALDILVRGLALAGQSNKTAQTQLDALVDMLMQQCKSSPTVSGTRWETDLVELACLKDLC